MLEQNKRKQEKTLLVCILAFGFLLRLVLATATEGYVYDINCFFAWGLRLAEVGPQGFYAEDYFCDYPPAYLYVLGLVGHFMKMLEVNYLEKTAQVLLVFVPAFADMAIALGLYGIAHKMENPKLALRLVAFVAFCPMFWYDAAVWKQIDSVLAVCMLASFYCLGQKRWLPAAAFYGLALAVKPQALIVGPVFGLCFLLPVLFAADGKAFWQAIKNGVLGVMAALAPLYLCALPFFGFGNTFGALYKNYTTTASSYPYATVNAFNFMAACGGNWVPQTNPMQFSILGGSIPMFFGWETFGLFAIAASSVLVGYLGVRTYRANATQGRFSPVFLAAVYMIAIFTFGHRMHERYLLLGVVLLLGAVAQYGSVRLLTLAGGFSLTMLLNMAVVYTVVDTDDNFLTSASSILTMRVVALAETVLCIVLLYEAWQICMGKCRVHTLFGAQQGQVQQPEGICATLVGTSSAMAATTQKAAKQKGVKQQPLKSTKKPTEKAPYQVAPQQPWQKKEVAFVALLTLGVAVLSFTYLGEFTAPQNPLDLRESSHTETVLPQGEATSLWLYTGVTTSGASLTVTDAQGNLLLENTLEIGSLFQWQLFDIAPSEAYQVAIAGAQVIEIGFKDAQGNLLPLAFANDGTPSAMFDEQSLIPTTKSQLNGFYFDEIYHARTAYESVHGLDIYEISHPPMGKNFIALGVMLFGMTGFGWRFSGVLFGVLMVPVMYWLTRRLSRNTLVASFVALLLSFDFMRYSQSRIATIDTISAFFILLSATCMVWYCQSVLQKGVRNSILPMALAGLAFGFGAASKWTGIYAGAGLAILYFAVLAVRFYQQKQTLAQLLHNQPSAPSPRTQRKQAKHAPNHAEKASEKMQASQQAITATTQEIAAFPREVVVALAGGVLFFVCIPLIIYLASYLPYKLANPNFGLLEWWQNQTYMYDYHSGLEATHSFSSAWYTWFLDLRPVWYYMGHGLPADTYASIAGFYNPILCWVGIAAWLRLCFRGLQGKGNFVSNALIVFFLSQITPWLLITRCTFLYHYFPSFLFTLVAIGLWFQDLLAQKESRAHLYALVLLTMVVVFFIWFYPALSGLPVGATWAQSLKFLPSYGFYIIN